MKRLWLLTAALAILAVILGVVSLNRQDDVLRIGTIPTSRSLLVEAGGSFSVTLYFSHAEPLFVKRELIQDVRIVDEINEASLSVRAIDRLDERLRRGEETYHAYRFVFELAFSVPDGFALEWRDAQLRFAYADGILLNVPIGTLAIRIGTVSPASPLSLERLYGRKGTGCGIERVLIGLRNHTDEPIAVRDWETGLSDYGVLAERVGGDHPQTALDRLDRFGTAVSTEATIVPAGEIVYLVLRLSGGEDRSIRQFYLHAVWVGLGKTDAFVIDDFVYVAEEGGLCDDRFAEVVFRYPR